MEGWVQVESLVLAEHGVIPALGELGQDDWKNLHNLKQQHLQGLTLGKRSSVIHKLYIHHHQYPKRAPCIFPRLACSPGQSSYMILTQHLESPFYQSMGVCIICKHGMVPVWKSEDK